MEWLFACTEDCVGGADGETKRSVGEAAADGVAAYFSPEGTLE